MKLIHKRSPSLVNTLRGRVSTDKGSEDGTSTLRATKVDPREQTEVSEAEGILDVSAGYSHVLILTGGNRILTWGDGAYGKLGQKDTFPRSQPTPLPNSHQLPKFTLIKASAHSSFAISETGVLYTWGDNKFSILGHVAQTIQKYPKPIFGILSQKRIISCSVGERHAACVAETGEAYTWGDSSFGVLGHGEAINNETPIQQTPRLVEHLSKIQKKCTQISCGLYHTLALTSDSLVFVWGDEGSHGVLGLSNHDGESHVEATPLLLVSLQGKQVTSIRAGLTHSICLTASGEVYVWGEGTGGRLGLGDHNDRTEPTLVPVLKDMKIIQVQCGYFHSCALTDTGAVYVWGAGGLSLGMDPHRVQFSALRDSIVDPNKEHSKTADFPQIYSIPTRVNFLKGKKVSTVCCGPTSTVCLQEPDESLENPQDEDDEDKIDYDIWVNLPEAKSVKHAANPTAKSVDMSGPSSDKMESYLNTACARSVYSGGTSVWASVGPGRVAEVNTVTDRFQLKIVNRRLIACLSDGVCIEGKDYKDAYVASRKAVATVMYHLLDKEQRVNSVKEAGELLCYSIENWQQDIGEKKASFCSGILLEVDVTTHKVEPPRDDEDDEPITETVTMYNIPGLVAHLNLKKLKQNDQTFVTYQTVTTIPEVEDMKEFKYAWISCSLGNGRVLHYSAKSKEIKDVTHQAQMIGNNKNDVDSAKDELKRLTLTNVYCRDEDIITLVTDGILNNLDAVNLNIPPANLGLLGGKTWAEVIEFDPKTANHVREEFRMQFLKAIIEGEGSTAISPKIITERLTDYITELRGKGGKLDFCTVVSFRAASVDEGAALAELFGGIGLKTEGDEKYIFGEEDSDQNILFMEPSAAVLSNSQNAVSLTTEPTSPPQPASPPPVLQPVKAATLVKLVERLTHEKHLDTDFVAAFLLTCEYNGGSKPKL
eukprot:TRINITY_DN4225_c0_g1_i1.p1 TRINITY_DN4225_c0_g1~~TRINITY_DN4225_c0_g1_i1.p1  ORF type:complete len:936 (+),score=205.63 TRINITY_DN4225_c0_g1_i1:53-2860(+)